MITLSPAAGALRSVLCLGAHCDDIEIGCGGTLMRLSEQNPLLRFHWIIFSGDTTREAESRAAARTIHSGVQGGVEVQVLRFPDGFFPASFAEIKKVFEVLSTTVQPDLVFTHRLEDRHQDHKTLADLTWNTFRNHLVLEYEIPKYEGDLGHPNLYSPLSANLAERKVSMLMQCFSSQKTRSWFNDGVFTGLMRVRGLECRAESGCAEAFYARKVLI